MAAVYVCLSLRTVAQKTMRARARDPKFRIAAFLMILLACVGCRVDRDNNLPSSPTLLPIFSLETAATIGDVSITILEASYWRDWMPEVENPGPDGGSPLRGVIRLRLDNSKGDQNKLSFTTVIYDEEKRAHAVDFFVLPDPQGNVWNGSVASGEIKEIQIQTETGPYLSVGTRISTVINWTDQGQNDASLRTLETPIKRTE
jgi:hypothetical protein